MKMEARFGRRKTGEELNEECINDRDRKQGRQQERENLSKTRMELVPFGSRKLREYGYRSFEP
jgi:hypothetical protein